MVTDQALGRIYLEIFNCTKLTFYKQSCPIYSLLSYLFF